MAGRLWECMKQRRVRRVAPLPDSGPRGHRMVETRPGRRLRVLCGPELPWTILAHDLALDVLRQALDELRPKGTRRNGHVGLCEPDCDTSRPRPLLFFVHGTGDSADVWHHQVSFFGARGFRTVALDLVGHGLSCAPDDPKAYTFTSLLDDVLAVFDRFCLERNIVVGHAYGACFAAAMARLRPKLVSHLVLLSGGGPFPLCPAPSRPKLPCCCGCCWQKQRRRMQAYHVPSRRQAEASGCLDVPPFVLHSVARGQVWLEGDASFHRQIGVPTLLVYGLRDPFVTLVEECEMEKTIPRAFLELIPDAGHMLMLQAPDELNDVIHNFLKRWER